MLEFGRPAFLFAGAALALVPLLLHLIARRPPERSPLPTARFLTPDTRTALRIERRPTDILLLVLRTLFLLILALGFAAPRWVAARTGTIELILLDRGRGMAGSWPEAVDSARALVAAAPDARVLVFDTTVSTLRMDADDDAAWNTLRSGGVAGVESDYADAFRALASATDRTRADSARVSLITAPRWGAWSEGTSLVRESAWPGAIRLIELPLDLPASPLPASPFTASVLGAGTEYASAALDAIGVVLGSDTATSDLLLVFDTLISEADGASLLERIRGGATVIIAGGSVQGALSEVLPWRSSDAPGALPPVTFDDGAQLDDVVSMRPGTPLAGAALIAAGANGRAAAVSTTHGQGCLVFFAGSLAARDVALARGYTAALRRLARGCAGPAGTGTRGSGTDVLPLDAAARDVLSGPGLPREVALAAFEGERSGRALGRVLLALALAIAVVETWFSHRRRRL